MWEKATDPRVQRAGERRTVSRLEGKVGVAV